MEINIGIIEVQYMTSYMKAWRIKRITGCLPVAGFPRHHLQYMSAYKREIWPAKKETKDNNNIKENAKT